MGTATCRRVGVAAAAALAFVVSGCGAATHGSRSPANAFAWLRPAAAPAGWTVARISTGAALAYPPGWRRVSGDFGTATAVLLDRRHRFLGYLNVTPRQDHETLSNWGSYRPDHNAEEGDRAVVTIAHAADLRFRTGRAACVQDSYTGKTGVRYVEVACLVAGRRATTVIVGAAPPGSWSRTSPVIERAISAVTT